MNSALVPQEPSNPVPGVRPLPLPALDSWLGNAQTRRLGPDPQSQRWGNGTPKNVCKSASLPIELFQFQKKNPLSGHGLSPIHPLLTAILVKIRGLQSDGHVTQSLPHY